MFSMARGRCAFSGLEGDQFVSVLIEHMLFGNHFGDSFVASNLEFSILDW